MARVVVAGSINMDVVTRVRRFPRPGETVLADGAALTPGGKGANQAVAARRCGAEVALVGRVGADAFGDSLLRFLRAEGVDVTSVSVSDSAPSGAAVITVDAHGENSIVVAGGANNELSAEELSGLHLAPGDVVLSQNEISAHTAAELFRRAAGVGALSVFNAAPALADRQELVALADIVVVNETERDALPPRPEGRILVVTLGSAGVCATTPHGEIRLPGRVVEPKDTTGAGDCFVGALAACLAAGQSLEFGLGFANAAASLAVQERGAAESMPTLDAVEEVLR